MSSVLPAGASLSLILSGRMLQTQHILVTDVGQRYEDALICVYRSDKFASGSNWYQKLKQNETFTKLPLNEHHSGWFNKKQWHDPNTTIALIRKMGTVASEGTFICRAGGGGSVSVNIHYPSELSLHMFFQGITLYLMSQC